MPIGALSNSFHGRSRISHELPFRQRRQLAGRLMMRPSTTTVSRFSGSADPTSRCVGSTKLPMFSASVVTVMMSARLPGVRDPTLSSMPIERAPSIVPSSSTRRAVSLNSLNVRAFSASRTLRVLRKNGRRRALSSSHNQSIAPVKEVSCVRCWRVYSTGRDPDKAIVQQWETDRHRRTGRLRTWEIPRRGNLKPIVPLIRKNIRCWWTPS